MTRAQRIALAMCGYLTAPQAVAAQRVYSVPVYFFTSRGCYDAMDDLDPYQDVNPSESIVFVRGNAGMCCA